MESGCATSTSAGGIDNSEFSEAFGRRHLRTSGPRLPPPPFDLACAPTELAGRKPGPHPRAARSKERGSSDASLQNRAQGSGSEFRHCTGGVLALCFCCTGTVALLFSAGVPWLMPGPVGTGRSSIVPRLQRHWARCRPARHATHSARLAAHHVRTVSKYCTTSPRHASKA